MVWRDLGLNPCLPDHWRTLYPLAQRSWVSWSFLQNNNHQAVKKMKWIENRKNTVKKTVGILFNSLHMVVSVWVCAGVCVFLCGLQLPINVFVYGFEWSYKRSASFQSDVNSTVCLNFSLHYFISVWLGDCY